ncbi:MAG: hypothetical protein HY691_17820 [Chloroflexi bacterium]|nr:hypothetical protein [Chloroflexota bacterium]
MRLRPTKLTPWERRQQAERLELEERLERFEHMVMAALHEHDGRVAAQHAGSRAAYAIQQTDQLLQRTARLQERVDLAERRLRALTAMAGLVRREVRWRMLATTLAVPAVFAGWLWIVGALGGR